MKRIFVGMALMIFGEPACALRTLKDLDAPLLSFKETVAALPEAAQVPLAPQQVLPLLQEAAADQIPQEVEVILEPLHTLIPEGEEEALQVTSFTPNSALTRFTAVLESPGAQVKLKGKLSVQREVPVLARLPEPGEPLTDQDLVWKKVPARQITRATLTKTQDILGCVLRSGSVQMGSPLRRSDLERPVLIKRGEGVLITLQDAHISLEVQGTALESGQLQQRIRVLNPVSKRTLHAIVVAPHHVQIEPPLRLAQLGEGATS